MRTSAQFARRLPANPSASTHPALQNSFSRPVTVAGTVGFAFLSVSLAAVTFVVTIWGVDLPLETANNAITVDAASVLAPEYAPSPEAEIVYEPKTTGRLPVFGGMTAADH